MLQSATVGLEPAEEYLELSTRQGSALLNYVSAGSLQPPNFTFNPKSMQAGQFKTTHGHNLQTVSH